MLDDSSLVMLYNDELKDFEANDVFASFPSQQRQLIKNIIDYNLSITSLSFIKFYCKKNEIDYENVKDKVTNLVRVRKSRLNVSLKTLNLYIDKSFKLYRIDFKFINYFMNESKKVIKNPNNSIKIFDFYEGKDKRFILNEEVKETLIAMLHYNRSIYIISNFNDERTKQFYQDLLEEHSNIGNESVLEIYYMRKSFIQSSSLIYALVNDEKDNDYIIYYENITKWNVITAVSKNLTFTTKFHELLESRFLHYIRDQELLEKKEIIQVKLDFFNSKFDKKIQNITKKLSVLIDKELKTKQQISKEVNSLIEDLKIIQLTSPKANYSVITLYHHIKLVEIKLLLRTDNELINTRKVFKDLLELDITKKLYIQIKDEILENQFFLKEYIAINDIPKLKEKLNFLYLFDNKSLTDVYSGFYWNNQSQITDSLNNIIMDVEKAHKLILFFLKDSSPITNKLSSENKSIIQIVLRIIFKVVYGIKFATKVKVNEDEKKIFKSLILKDVKIKKEIDALINKGGLRSFSSQIVCNPTILPSQSIN